MLGLCCKKSGRDARDVKAHLPVQLSTTATLKSLKQKR
jgi:hypothetical protein